MLKPLLAAAALALLAVPAVAADLEANKKIVVDFYNKGLNDKDFDAAAKYFWAALHPAQSRRVGGPQGFKNLVTLLKEKFPELPQRDQARDRRGRPGRAARRSVRDARRRASRAIVDIFKMENGKIVEHWDVIQDVPEKAANCRHDVLALSTFFPTGREAFFDADGTEPFRRFFPLPAPAPSIPAPEKPGLMRNRPKPFSHRHSRPCLMSLMKILSFPSPVFGSRDGRVSVTRQRRPAPEGGAPKKIPASRGSLQIAAPPSSKPIPREAREPREWVHARQLLARCTDARRSTSSPNPHAEERRCRGHRVAVSPP